MVESVCLRVHVCRRSWHLYDCLHTSWASANPCLRKMHAGPTMLWSMVQLCTRAHRGSLNSLTPPDSSWPRGGGPPWDLPPFRLGAAVRKINTQPPVTLSSPTLVTKLTKLTAPYHTYTANGEKMSKQKSKRRSDRLLHEDSIALHCTVMPPMLPNAKFHKMCLKSHKSRLAHRLNEKLANTYTLIGVHSFSSIEWLQFMKF